MVEHSLLNKYYRRCPPWDFDSQQSIVFTDIVVCSMCIKSMYAVRIFITLVSSESTLCCIRQQWFCKLNIFREVLNYRYAIWGVLWFITCLKWYEVCKLLLNYQGLNKLSVAFFQFFFLAKSTLKCRHTHLLMGEVTSVHVHGRLKSSVASRQRELNDQFTTPKE